jgi:ABC-type branched-subunit amino acid transport system ATPase component
MLLAVEEVTKRFGGLTALDRVSLSLEPGKIYGLIGPNGSGKTTLVNIISGFLRPDHGRIVFDDKPIEGLSPHLRARRGLCRTFQLTVNPRRMTVMENMLLGPIRQRGESIWRAAVQPGRVRAEEAAHLERAWRLLEMVNLHGLADEYAGSLSGGQKKLLALVQVLMAEPRLVLLDEPVAGVNPRLIEKIVEVIRHLQAQGYDFLIVEHNMGVVRTLCDILCVLDMGQVLAQGPPAEVLAREDVLRAYIAAGGQVDQRATG